MSQVEYSHLEYWGQDVGIYSEFEMLYPHNKMPWGWAPNPHMKIICVSTHKLSLTFAVFLVYLCFNYNPAHGVRHEVVNL